MVSPSKVIGEGPPVAGKDLQLLTGRWNESSTHMNDETTFYAHGRQMGQLLPRELGLIAKENFHQDANMLFEAFYTTGDPWRLRRYMVFTRSAYPLGPVSSSRRWLKLSSTGMFLVESASTFSWCPSHELLALCCSRWLPWQPPIPCLYEVDKILSLYVADERSL